MNLTKPGDIIEWSDGQTEPHRWKVTGCYIGALGVESLIEIENITHKPGWTGQWETHQMMFVPECLLRGTGTVAITGAVSTRAASTANSSGSGAFWRFMKGLLPGIAKRSRA